MGSLCVPHSVLAVSAVQSRTRRTLLTSSFYEPPLLFFIADNEFDQRGVGDFSTKLWGEICELIFLANVSATEGARACGYRSGAGEWATLQGLIRTFLIVFYCSLIGSLVLSATIIFAFATTFW